MRTLIKILFCKHEWNNIPEFDMKYNHIKWLQEIRKCVKCEKLIKRKI